MIQLTNVAKMYGNNYAVKDVTFDIKKGEILGFLGRNGAGKTTTMNIITGYISMTEGSVTVDGFDILKNPIEAKRKIGYLPEQPPLYLDMTVREYLSFSCELKGIKGSKEIIAQIDKVAYTVKVEDVIKRPLRNLSKGYRQRVGIAQALIGSPDYIILDEPTVGLDPMQIIEIRSLIKELKKECTVILSSHILPEVSDVCERLVIIHKGRIVAQDSINKLLSQLGANKRLKVRVKGDTDVFKSLFLAVPGVISVDLIGEMEPQAYDYILQTEEGADVREHIAASIVGAKQSLLMLKPMDITLEDVFLRVIDEEKEV